MSGKVMLRMVETLLIGTIGGAVFFLLEAPLPWLLGALTFVMVYQGITNREAIVPSAISNSGFLMLGIYFGLYFTRETILTVVPYLIPYLFFSVLLIMTSILLGYLVTKWIKIDPLTSVLSVVPGGLSEMVLVSKEMNANSTFVVIFQTIRLISILFIIPSLMFYFFADRNVMLDSQTAAAATPSETVDYLWFILPVVASVFLKNRIPAGIMIGSLGVTALLNISPIDMPSLSIYIMYAAQIAIGADLGKSIRIEDLKLGGKYSFIYLGITLVVIGLSLGFGYLLATITGIDYPTAMLSLAPGGLFEMVITSYSIDGDPAIVTSFQLLRITIIVSFVPPILKWGFHRKRQKDEEPETLSEKEI